MENRRIPKSRYNGSTACDRKSAGREPEQSKIPMPDKLKKIGEVLDKRAEDTALIITDMFKFMSMSIAMLPNMELDVGVMRLKVDDAGIIFEINNPVRNCCEDCCGCDDELNDDDEEGLLYDGD